MKKMIKKRPVGRPAKPTNECRSVNFNVRLTPDETKTARQLAEQYDCNPVDILRNVLTNPNLYQSSFR